MGASSDSYRITVQAAGRELDGVRQGGEAPVWTLGPDCAGVAELAPVMGSQDTGGPDITRTLVPSKPGSCTLKASVLAVAAERTIQIK